MKHFEDRKWSTILCNTWFKCWEKLEMHENREKTLGLKIDADKIEQRTNGRELREGFRSLYIHRLTVI